MYELSCKYTHPNTYGGTGRRASIYVLYDDRTPVYGAISYQQSGRTSAKTVSTSTFTTVNTNPVSALLRHHHRPHTSPRRVPRASPQRGVYKLPRRTR
eukprot:5358743-Prymnesium_polylepis.2